MTGTDRLAEAAQKIDYDIYLNVQGDEPLVDPKDIIKIRDTKISRMDQVINGFCSVLDTEDPHSINIPKVITNEKNELVYISRLALPGFKQKKFSPNSYKKQVCIYAFTKNELDLFINFSRKSTLEQAEDIEILRFLELDKTIFMIETKPGSLAIDVPDDIQKVEERLKSIK